MALLHDAASAPSARMTRSAGNALRLRVLLAGRAAALAVTSFLGIGVFVIWITFVALSPFTIVASLVIPATWLMRTYANANRRAAGRLLGHSIPAPYRPAGEGVFGRIKAVVRDPASWRDAWWSVTHAVVGGFLSILSIGLFLGSVLYLIYPFLYAVTPHAAFGRPFGGLVDLHSTRQSFVMMPIGLVTLVIWWFLAPALARGEAAFTRSLLAPRVR